MIKKYTQPEFLFLITGLLIVACRLLFAHESLDIPIHDTYIVMDAFHVTFLMTVLFGILALPYTFFRMINKPLSKIGGWIHYALTMLPWLIVITVFPIITRYDSTHHYSESMRHIETYNAILVVSCMMFVFGQLLFLVNIIVTLFKGKNVIQ